MEPQQHLMEDEDFQPPKSTVRRKQLREHKTLVTSSSSSNSPKRIQQPSTPQYRNHPPLNQSISDIVFTPNTQALAQQQEPSMIITDQHIEEPYDTDSGDGMSDDGTLYQQFKSVVNEMKPSSSSGPHLRNVLPQQPTLIPSSNLPKNKNTSVSNNTTTINSNEHALLVQTNMDLVNKLKEEERNMSNRFKEFNLMNNELTSKLLTVQQENALLKQRINEMKNGIENVSSQRRKGMELLYFGKIKRLKEECDSLKTIIQLFKVCFGDIF